MKNVTYKQRVKPLKCMGSASFLILNAVTLNLLQAAEAETFRLEEVVVTAQKRVESLQDVPISVSAMSGDQMDKLGINGIQDIAARTPGLKFGNYSDIKLSPTALRGISTIDATSAGKDPAIGYYLDEVFLGVGASASLEFFDIERIEVLRGPQGTLFGRNSVGGLINITTRKPTDVFEGNFSVDVGDYNLLHTKGSVNVPVIDNELSARLSVSYRERDGYTDNGFLGIDGDDAKSANYRGVVSYTPTDTSEYVFRVDYRDIKQHPKLYETLSYDPASLILLAGQGDLPGFGQIQLNTDPDDRVVFSDIKSLEELEGWGVSLNSSVGLSGADFVSVTSYREHDYYNVGDTDMSPLDILTDGDPESVWRFSQEFRLSSNTGQSLSWIAGLYYFRQHTENEAFVTVGDDLSVLVVGDTSLGGLKTGSDAVMDLSSYAIFGSATYDVSEQLSLTLGGRYTFEEKELDYSQFDPIELLGGTASLIAKDDWSEFTPSVSARYFASEDIMAYATISKGYKSGGYNDSLGEATGISFDPEFLWNYEIGFKSTLLAGRMVINGAVFYMEWDDIQIQADDPNTAVFDPRTSNAGSAVSQGVELEFKYRPSEALTLGVAGTVLDAEFNEGTLPTGPGEPAQVLSKMERAPEYNLNVTADYTLPIGEWGSLTFTGEVLTQGDMYLTLDNSDEGKVNSFSVLNGQIMLTSKDYAWSLTLWGRNLTDKTYKERLFDLSSLEFVGQKLVSYAAPRTYGLRLNYSF